MDVHATKLGEFSRRTRRWYLERKRAYERVKLTTKSRYVETRGRLARCRGDNASARRYFGRGLKYRRTLHDAEPALADLVALSSLERDRGLLGEAAERLQEARQVLVEADPTAEFFEEVIALRRAYEDRGDDEAAAEWFFTEIYLARAVEPDFHERRAERHRRYLELADSPDSAVNVYDLALRNLLYGDDDLAGECLAETWSRRERLEAHSEGFVLVLAAGAGLLASGEVAAGDREEILAVLEENRRRLSEPAGALFDALSGGDSEPQSFDADVDPASIRANLGQLEQAAFGQLLDELREQRGV